MKNETESSPTSAWQGPLCVCLYQLAPSSWNCSVESMKAFHRWTPTWPEDDGEIVISLVEGDND
jgi:hypothetical protein